LGLSRWAPGIDLRLGSGTKKERKWTKKERNYYVATEYLGQ
jgi:hypothetical protein